MTDTDCTLVKPCKNYREERPPRGGRGAHVTGQIGVKGIALDQYSKPPNTLLGARLRELRLEAGLDQRSLAKRLGWGTGGRVSDHELGHHLPTLEILGRYADIFGITVSQLLDGVM
jgi:DNA-binding XRE family transcriptional regulator